MSINVSYHANTDTGFKPVVEFVEAHDCIPDYYRLRLNPYDVTIFATRAQLVQIAEAIDDGLLYDVLDPEESKESFEASEALLPVLHPVTVQVQHPNIPEWEARS